ncbi:MAG: hypothetical protein DRH12_04190 [Deltaproteobacteria bacterium]|nr:MAG: hypothetical protein DRH12_04190 [Deltaproteobacteria bacterium]
MEILKEIARIVVPLLIIMDPLGNLPFFMMFTAGKTPAERNRTAAVATVTAALILLFFALTGNFVLNFFHISLPAFQLAGGFIFFIYALQMLALIPTGLKTSDEEEHEAISKDSVALVPLATPFLAGPGAITAVLVWRDRLAGLPIVAVFITAILLACLLVYLAFRFGHKITNLLGVGGIRVLTRLMGLLLAVIAAEFIVEGLRGVF